MKTFLCGAIALALASPAAAQGVDDREIARLVFEDAKVVRRIADVARRELPRDVLQKIVDEDLETLRGKTAEYEYRYASWARTEARRDEERFTIKTDKESPELESLEMKGRLVYRFRLQVPGRRMLLLNNRHVWVDRVDLTYLPIGRSTATTETVEIKAWLEPGEERMIDVRQIAREATAVAWASTDPGEKGSLDVAAYSATLVDNPDSPFATVVRRVSVIEDAVRERDYRKLRNLADEVIALLEARAEGPGGPRAPALAATPEQIRRDDDIYFELREIHVRMTGDEASRREAQQRLERLIERLRP